jgi:hypothetical protein
MTISSHDYAHRQRYLHGPAWRRQLGEVELAKTQPGDSPAADPQLQRWCAFLRLQRGVPQDGACVVKEFKDLAAAAELAADRGLSKQLQVLVLGDCTPEAIKERLGIDANVLAAWEGVYFDVRAVRTALDWIACQVIEPVQQQGDVALAAKLKLACAAGPRAALAALDAESRVLTRSGPTLFDLKVCLHLKFQQAVELSLDTDQQRRFYIKTHGNLLHREKQLQLAERKLQWQCEEALRKQAVAESKRQLRGQRATARAAQVAAKKTAAQEAEVQACRRQPEAEVLPPSEVLQPSKRVSKRRAVASTGRQPLEHAAGSPVENRPKIQESVAEKKASKPRPRAEPQSHTQSQPVPLAQEPLTDQQDDVAVATVVQQTATPSESAGQSTSVVTWMGAATTVSTVTITTVVGAAGGLPEDRGTLGVADQAKRRQPSVAAWLLSVLIVMANSGGAGSKGRAAPGCSSHCPTGGRRCAWRSRRRGRARVGHGPGCATAKAGRRCWRQSRRLRPRAPPARAAWVGAGVLQLGGRWRWQMPTW